MVHLENSYIEGVACSPAGAVVHLRFLYVQGAADELKRGGMQGSEMLCTESKSAITFATGMVTLQAKYLDVVLQSLDRTRTPMHTGNTDKTNLPK